MTRLPVVSAKEAIQALSKIGYAQIRQSGSHIVLQKRSASSTKTVVVPNHSELAKGTLRAILRKAELSVEEFQTLL